MATTIILPHLGESIEMAVLSAWLKRPGDPVKRGDELADLETDKATLPLESPANGVLLATLVEEGSEVRVGQPVAVVGQPGEVWPPPAALEPELQPLISAPISEPAPVEAQPAPAARQYRITPLARRKARELGVDLSSLRPETGDKISGRDVERWAQTPAPPTEAGVPSRRVPLSNLKRIVGRRMLESVQQVPQFSVSVQADAARMLAFREAQAAEGHKVTMTALLLALTAAALQRHPLLNARFDGDALIVYETCNIGVAVASPDGLRLPVVRGVERLALRQINQQVAELAEKARANRLAAHEISDGTFTLSNLGMFGVTQFMPIVNPPQAAILGVGRPQPAFVPDGRGGLALVQLLTLTISADHRVVDGADVAAFLQTLKAEIERCEIENAR